MIFFETKICVYEVLTDLYCNNTNKINQTNSFLKKENIFLRYNKKKMLQRIQTVYMIIAFVTIGILPMFTPLWKVGDGIPYYFMSSMVYQIIIGMATSLTMLSIISFKKRKQQFVFNRLNIILNLILLGLFVYRSLNISGEAPAVSEKGIGMFLPIVSIVLLVLANKAIQKDENLVKSVDRLR